MKRIMLTAMGSDQGKTVLTCALLLAFKRRGLAVRAFKCGPDYIDPMFHSRVLGVPSRNLDLFLQGEAGVRRTLEETAGEVALLEGAMGYYDGLAGTEEASAYAMARLTGTPAVLVLRPRGASLTLAAQICGLINFRKPSYINGIMLTDCGASRYESLKPLLERETGLPVLGYLPHDPDAALPSRHLGLLTAGEIADFTGRFERLAETLEKTADIDGLFSLAAEGETRTPPPFPEPVCRLAVARDEAFCFCYADTLDALRRAGAKLCFFSPLRDRTLPEGVCGLYLPGGYSELYARILAENTTMRAEIRRAVRGGLPTVAECGGFLYLQQELEDDGGTSWPQCGVLPGKSYRTKGLRRFGYARLEAAEDSLLFRRGERVPVHEFHYWDSSEGGRDLTAYKPDGRSWPCCFTSPTLYAGFPHLCFAGETPVAERFVEQCANYGNKIMKREL